MHLNIYHIKIIDEPISIKAINLKNQISILFIVICAALRLYRFKFLDPSFDQIFQLKFQTNPLFPLRL